MSEEPVKLKVAAAIPRDQGRGIIRLNSEIRRHLDVGSGDYILIKGTKETVAICFPAMREDDILDMVRIDSIVRNNAGVKLGEVIEVSKATVPDAARIVFGPTQPLRFPPGFDEHFKQQMLNRPVTRGDVVLFAAIGQAHPFVVSAVTPSKSGKVTPDTNVEVLDKPVKPEDVTVPEVTYEDIGGLGSGRAAVRRDR